MEIEELLEEKKSYITESFVFPNHNQEVKLDAIGDTSRTKYFVDINRKSYQITKKVTCQNRAHTSVVLMRLDYLGRDHTNPDNQRLSGTHIHIYKEGFGVSWAYTLDDPFLQTLNSDFDLNLFKTDDITKLFDAFSVFCRFINRPIYALPELT